MKPFERKFFVTYLVLFGISSSCLAQGGADNQTCGTAFSMAEPNDYSGNFFDGGLVSPENTPTCITSSQNFPLREVWYKFTTDAISTYYLYCTGIVGAMEVYSGTCANLSLIGCIATNEATAYGELSPNVVQTFYVRLVGYSLPGFSTYSLNYNSVDFTPSCNVSIDNIEIYPCVNVNGMIPVAVSGSLTDNQPLFAGVFVEIDTDENTYFTQEVQTSGTWTANFLISGTQITHVYAIYGPSETSCLDVVSNLTLPTQPCSEAASLTGVLNWNKHCVQRTGEVWLYDPNSDQLRAHYDVEVQDDGKFIIDYPILGVFDILIEFDGYLAKGYQDVEIQNSANSLECGALIGGDLNGDNHINFVDVSIFNEWFGLVPPEDFPALDPSCDGYVNFNDISIINSGYGIIGATVPL